MAEVKSWLGICLLLVGACAGEMHFSKTSKLAKLLKNAPWVQPTKAPLQTICDNPQCELISDICQNGGTCEIGEDCSIKCHCALGYSGVFCGIKENGNGTKLSNGKPTTTSTTEPSTTSKAAKSDASKTTTEAAIKKDKKAEANVKPNLVKDATDQSTPGSKVSSTTANQKGGKLSKLLSTTTVKSK